MDELLLASAYYPWVMAHLRRILVRTSVLAAKGARRLSPS